MSIAGAQASKFYEQATAEGRVFTVDDGQGYLIFSVRDAEVVPFWSSESRLLRIQKSHLKYAQWEITEEPLSEFLDKTLMLFKEENIRVGINWSGQRLTGYDLSVDDLRRSLQYWIEKKANGEQ